MQETCFFASANRLLLNETDEKTFTNECCVKVSIKWIFFVPQFSKSLNSKQLCLVVINTCIVPRFSTKPLSCQYKVATYDITDGISITLLTTFMGFLSLGIRKCIDPALFENALRLLHEPECHNLIDRPWLRLILTCIPGN